MLKKGDGLVAEVMKRLAEIFADERAKLEQQWDRATTSTPRTCE